MDITSNERLTRNQENRYTETYIADFANIRHLIRKRYGDDASVAKVLIGWSIPDADITAIYYDGIVYSASMEKIATMLHCDISDIAISKTATTVTYYRKDAQ